MVTVNEILTLANLVISFFMFVALGFIAFRVWILDKVVRDVVKRNIGGDIEGMADKLEGLKASLGKKPPGIPPLNKKDTYFG